MTFMKEGCPFRRSVSFLAAIATCSGTLWGCAQRTTPQQPFKLPERSSATEPEIKVRLFDLDDFTCDVGAPSKIIRFGGKPYAGELTVSYTTEELMPTWVLQRGKKVLAKQRSAILRLTSAEPITVQKTLFPTTSLAMRIEGERMEVVGRFALETYLPGVLQRELFAKWDIDTYKAQAVAARSYSLVKMQDRRGKFWHVRASPSDQAFVGGVLRPVARDAVAATKGQVLTWDNQILCTYYSSCCGGRPARAADIFSATSNAVAPLSGQGKPCPCQKSGRYRWTTEVSGKALGGRVGLQTVQSIRPIQSNPWSRATKLRLQDARGSVVDVSPEKLRDHLAALGSKAFSGWILKSQYQGGVLTLEGAGFGHGVGMCQYGSEARARDGVGWREILALSYPGAKIATNWGP
ncbi:MAG: SpoIID/LytB domain-containing protein [Planctomycetota bacterium]